ncbi:NAD(P)H-hydrate dehydratase [Sphingomonas sp. CL5.1]|uniref:NAD(P)H-hydrate dehydratase n=1 Tax=Sphingomonas sp. CL5.1 TaxID=2653203 RepID=UPI001581AA6A|nr:NAD(P)H-hydrate dehydratase [Sphingomonas sp. CL5.1]QKS00846.1 NAD(P)H-hydrate dehydratase [Sphingomonas sp. CL5.1]
MMPLDCRPILTAAAMRAAEERAVAAGTSVETLMERAGTAIAGQVRRLAGDQEVLILCGPGNNGGDGYVAARVLAAAGHPVRVAATGEPRSAAAIAARRRWDGAVEILGEARRAPVLVDALFGTGLTRGLEPEVAATLTCLAAGARLRIAVDLPSGAATDDGRLLSPVPEYDLTLALGALKPSHLLLPAAARARHVAVLDIGVAAESEVTALTRPRLSAPGAEAHKYSRGMVAIVAGAMPGASALAASAAAGGGAGYVLLLGSATDQVPHAVVRRRFDPVTLADHRIDALLIGPGLGRDERARERLDAAIDSDRPLVIDGDALRLVSVEVVAARKAPTILTPHMGEFDALFGASDAAKTDRALAAARSSGATIVFKGADTVIAEPDGNLRVATGAPTWLSTAGTGDVLAGLVAARLAVTRDPLAAAGEAVWLHGEAARRAGPAFIADDLARHLPEAIAACL